MNQRRPVTQIIIFIVISAILIVSGIFVYNQQRTNITRDIYSNLTYISRLKVNQIDIWLINKIVDARAIKTNYWLKNDLQAYLKNNSNNQILSRINNWLNHFKTNNDYLEILLFDKNLNKNLLSNNFNISNEMIINAKKAFISDSIQFIDVHKTIDNKIVLGYSVPLTIDNNGNNETIGVVVLVIDPNKTLFPLVQTWLTESKTAETLICRPDSNGALFLNNLRHNKHTALNLKIPLAKTEVPAVQAVLGRRGIFEGIDYRGKEVLSYLEKIPGTSWSMVTKVDYEEILAPIKQLFILILGSILLFIVLAATILAYSWRTNESRYYREKYTLEKERQKQEELLQLVIQSLPVGIWIHDKTGETVNRNKKADKMWDISEVKVNSYLDICAYNYETKQRIEKNNWPLWKALENGESSLYELVEFEKADKSKAIITYSVVPIIYDSEILGAVVVNEDITAIKNAENLIHKSLGEKEILLKELFHRTKNNLQIISSLISLQSEDISDQKTLSLLDEMKNRIQAIAIVHEQLYQSKEFSSVDLKVYIAKLIKLLKSSFFQQSKNINIIEDLESIKVSLDTAVPCGLIINELVSNAIKYAFPNNNKGDINILLRKNHNTIELTVSDNGVGVPESFDILGQETLGITLFKNIAEGQLNGKINVEVNHGLRFTVNFEDTFKEERLLS